MINSNLDNMGKSGPENVSIKDQVKFDVLINMEILNGCSHTCMGCFVNRKQDISEEKMYARLDELSEDILKYGLNLREFVMSPTDFFNAHNTIDVLKNETIQKVLRKNTGVRIASPARLDLVSPERLNEILEILDSDGFREDMVLEFIMPVTDIEQTINDAEYRKRIFDSLAILDKSPKLIDWSWTLNMSSAVANRLSTENYDRLIKSITEDYDTILEMNPAIARVSNLSMVKSNIEDWNKILEEVITDENKSKATLSMANLYCNSINFLGLTIEYDKEEEKVKTYLNVNLHEQALFKSKALDVSDMTLKEIMEYRTKLVSDSLSNLRECCKECQYSVACATRLIHNAMDFVETDSCILPKNVLDMFDVNNDNETYNEDALKLVIK